MATSGSYNWKATRDDIIKRACRLTGYIGENETPSTAATTEASQALNDLVKALQEDGMPLWSIKQQSIPLTATATYLIGIGQTVNVASPLKVIDAYIRTTATTTDSPLLIITRNAYNLLGNKSSTGTPNQIWYDPPGNLGSGNMIGTLTVYPIPDSTAISGKTIQLIYQAPFQDLDAAGDDIDFPSYWNQAVTWLLAKELSQEHGTPPSDKQWIAKLADEFHQSALNFGTEEGSLYFQPSFYR